MNRTELWRPGPPFSIHLPSLSVYCAALEKSIRLVSADADDEESIDKGSEAEGPYDKDGMIKALRLFSRTVV